LRAKGLTLGLISNMNQTAEDLLQRLGLSPALDFAVTSAEVKADKPHPAIFLAALEKAGVQPSDAVHVGDQYQSDVLGARNAGIRPVMMDRYRQAHASPDYPVVSSMPELEALLTAEGWQRTPLRT
ncbi:MAG: HAD-IA family hydrolase, partial [Chloroflexi bacterium]|nr:HAD-IA family hydrolase [Chloroflexota bacterium]